MAAVLHKMEDTPERTTYAFHCPGCKCAHGVRVAGSCGCWAWNRDLERPTFSPSILATGGEDRCHSYVRDGQIQFLSDCTHELAGQTAPLPAWDD
jgi:hypothetical protein